MKSHMKKVGINSLLLLLLLGLLVTPLGVSGFMHVKTEGDVLSTVDIRPNPLENLNKTRKITKNTKPQEYRKYIVDEIHETQETSETSEVTEN